MVCSKNIEEASVAAADGARKAMAGDEVRLVPTGHSGKMPIK